MFFDEVMHACILTFKLEEIIEVHVHVAVYLMSVLSITMICGVSAVSDS